MLLNDMAENVHGIVVFLLLVIKEFAKNHAQFKPYFCKFCI